MKWFETWFDSKYYHILYKHRDEQEAKKFLDNITQYLNITKGKILDVGCGKGRHAKYFNELGFNVVGIDLSLNSIAKAKLNETHDLKFYKFDMRNVFKENSFNVVTNLFTSFGYFDNSLDEQKTINAMVKNLKKDGILIIDFMNVKKIINNLVSKESKKINSVEFYITRELKDNYILKNISINDQDLSLKFQEKVHALTLIDFSEMLQKASMSIVDIFGNYNLDDFNASQSERLILIARK
ncbi:MAG: methyltransferase domain-containing protein [Flavobacteriales bacterium]|jgi:SAM-dependent methyltransferase|nr:methyltransferase domain-containing protein [Flavobacteriales bacterium]